MAAITDESRMEWVEIIEPRTKEHMYANLTTGECVWDPPCGVPVKKTNDNQWWELFDHNTSRFYYYNATTQRTVWHRPHNCDIIPLAKLQTLKQNTEVVKNARDTKDEEKGIKRESVATQTPARSALEKSSRGLDRVSANQVPTSSPESPRVTRRHHSHHHHHHHHHRHHSHATSHHSDDDGPTHAGEVRKSRRGSHSSQVSWYSRHGKSQDSGRSSDSSSVSLSRTSLEGSSYHGLDSPRRETRSRSNLGAAAPPSRFGSNASTGTASSASQTHSAPPSSSRHREAGREREATVRSLDKYPQRDPRIEGIRATPMSRQRSLDADSVTPPPRPPGPLPYKESSLSRSFSFMQRRERYVPDDEAMHEKYLMFPSGSGYRRRDDREAWSGTAASHSSHGSSSSHPHYEYGPSLDSLCTPMMNRKQRSLESNHSKRSAASSSSSHAQSTPQSQRERLLDKLRDLGSSISDSSSSSPQSPKRDYVPLSSSPFLFSSQGPDSGTSTLHDPLPSHQQYQRSSVFRSNDSSPHSSAVDSGLTTLGSRASQDLPSSTERSTSGKNQREKEKKTPSPGSVSVTKERTVVSEGSLANLETARGSPRSSPSSSSSASPSSTNDSGSKVKHSPGSGNGAMVTTGSMTSSTKDLGFGEGAAPLYSNIDYNYYFDSKAQAHLLPLQQYILEQAKLSGYRFGDPLAEETDSLHSDDSPNRHDDSDEFADDEGMSNPDSSSQEYLDDSHYLEEDDQYSHFMTPLQQRFKPLDIKTEPEYSEADGSYYPTVMPPLPPPPAQSPALSTGRGGLPPLSFPSHSHGHGHGSSNRATPTANLSAQRKEPSLPHIPSLYSPVMDKPGPFGESVFRPSPDLSALQRLHIDPPTTLPSPSLSHEKNAAEGDIEKYAQDNLNIHKKGLFRKNVSLRDMLSFSKDPIRKPMLSLPDKMLKKDACDVFKLVQIYMGDRKCKPGSTSNSVALELCNIGWNKPLLRDEMYLHICRQTTENPRKDSLRRGWELLSICLFFFPPSAKLQPYLEGYINRHRDPGLNFTEVDKWPIHVQVSHYATVCCKRLARIGVGGKRFERKPTLEEIEQSRLQIFRPSMFGNTLEEIMAVQKDRFPHRKLPWIQTTLSEEILRLHGAQTEGIFRVPADVDEVNALKVRMDQWEVGGASDAHVPASLLKLWYRELYEPLIPESYYAECIAQCNNPEMAVAIVHRLPDINRLVLCYLVRFLQVFSQTEVATVTKMDASNLAMVMAPNCLRCTSDDPRVIFENARKEMAFVRVLIQNLDTSFMEGVV